MMLWLLSLIACSACEVRVLLSAEQSEQINPLCYEGLSFLPTSNLEGDPLITGPNSNLTIFTITPFSITNFMFDLRHLHNYNDQEGNSQFNYSRQWEIQIFYQNYSSSLPTTTTSVEEMNNFKATIWLPEVFSSNETNSSYSFSMFAFHLLKVKIVIGVNESFDLVKYLFMNTTKINNLSPNRANYGENKIFMFVLQSTDGLSLPNNLMPLSPPSYLVNYTENITDLKPQNSSEKETSFSAYWSNQNYITQPYIPYFSNCNGSGQYLYFFQIVENQQLCNIVEVDQTKPVNPFVFGDKPNGDRQQQHFIIFFASCENIKYHCVLDESVPPKSSNPTWFQLGPDQSIFSMVPDPISPEEYNSGTFQVDKNNLVQVLVKNAIPQGKMASDVIMTVYYYQVTKTQKRIIQGDVRFANFYLLDDKQKQSGIQYNLILNYLPMDQGGLVKAFALEWPVYFIIFLGIGFLSFMEIVVFLFYHYILNRKKPRPGLRFMAYIRALTPAQISGTMLALLPLTMLLLLISIIMAGKLWDVDLRYACGLTPPTDADSGCGRVFFDIFKNQLKYTDSDFDNLRNSRCGITFIICGFYYMIYLSNLFVPLEDEEEEQKKKKEAYNGGIWDWKLWRKTQIIFVCLIVVFFMMNVAQFSFSQVFGENAYLFMIIMKILLMIIEYSLEGYIKDNLIIGPISCTIASMISISTMGCNDFYDFLFSYFVELGIQMMERAYIIQIEEEVINFLEGTYERVAKILTKLMDGDENEQQTEEEKLEGRKENLNNNNEMDSDSDIIFSDNYEENLASDDELSDQSWRGDQPGHLAHQSTFEQENNSFIESNGKDEFEEKFRNALAESLKKKLQVQHIVVANDEQITPQSVSETNEKIVDYSDIINYFSNFANDVVALVYTPYYTIIMWMFYEQSQWAANYGIESKNLLFYLIWAILLIPFQLAIDILFYNLIEQYHGMDILHYISLLKTRFDNRKTLWKGFEKDKGLKVEDTFIHLDQWCYSSQFYFIETLFLSAVMFIIFGMQTIYANNYDLFSDQALIFILLFWMALCYLIQKFSLFVGMKLGIWRVQNSIKVQPISQNEDDEQEDAISQKLQIQTDQNQTKTIQSLQIPNWDKAIRMREREERLKEINANLEQDNFKSEQIKKHIIANKIWFRDNLKLIFSPRTIKEKRKQILFQFQNIYGPIDKKKEDDPAEVFVIVRLYYSKGFEDIDKEEQPQQDIQFQKKKIILQNLNPTTQMILKYWLYRKRNLKRITLQVGGLIENQTKQYCEYCGLNWGLRAEPMTRIEDLYLNYLKQRGQKHIGEGQQIDDWQNFFSKNVKLKTTCYVCNMMMIEDLHKDKQTLIEKKKEEQHQKQRKYSFRKYARIVLIWIKFYRFATNQDIENMD